MMKTRVKIQLLLELKSKEDVFIYLKETKQDMEEGLYLHKKEI
jgi:hypothetical protein